MTISPSQKRYLRGLAHSLSPVILLGQKGVSPSLIAELKLALDHHELLKVRLSGADKEERAAQLAALVEASGAEIVQLIGHTASLWKRNEKEPRLPLPR
ncbi:MAG: ribosome assembly RNA-binding protein YhbY [Dokdonella sp.]|jgi:RNA-binding protein|uniref:ribosome assembly RNA-binding protein YhbY n=1 Tax=Dokdonella sp. TaxID=2291710 RepID=UPI001B5EC4A3|nr:ribosome assembly RNA-binding protein YhbY [Dokdonella sp.]MBK8122563.1 ribosome assembly RNA-binding protein YhbY [Dokdonella sp.]MBP6326036.1 ribosome assembly RNA-binding protein YhbY [Dokdonella sp.]MCC6441163.1 ribosome assembly RNA-binding protein YhbY [Rhodanobacteraceae bacterium]HQV48335.1 ribosome assembly RNA-binding protein YhbY [Dokdonella sp.]